jgi:head-tail adaptor
MLNWIKAWWIRRETRVNAASLLDYASRQLMIARVMNDPARVELLEEICADCRRQLGRAS